MNALCVFPTGCSPIIGIVSLLIIIWTIISIFLTWPSRSEARVPHPAISVVFWLIAAVPSLVLALVAQPKELSSNFGHLINEEPVTLLALVVALATYTSSVEQKIRETMKTRSPDRRGTHIDNLQWLQKSDASLVLMGFVLMLRLAIDPLGYHDEYLDRIVIGLLAWVIVFFAFLHVRQFILGLGSLGGGPPSLDVAIVSAIVQQVRNAQLDGASARAHLRDAERYFPDP